MACKEEEKTRPEQPDNPKNSGGSGSDDKEKLTDKLAGLWYDALNCIYRTLYFLGLQLLRIVHRRQRRIAHRLQHHGKLFQKDRERNQRLRKNRLRSLWMETIAPLRDVKERYQTLIGEVESEKRYGSGWSVTRAYGRLWIFISIKLGHLFRFLFNYIAPIAACVFLYVVISGYVSQNYALRLFYNDEELGYIADETVFNQAENEVRGRMVNEKFFVLNKEIPRFELATIDREELLSVDELTNLLISASGNDLKEADGLYLEQTINGRTQMTLVGAVENGTDLLLYLDSMLQKYRTPDMSANARIQFVKKLQLKRGLYPPSAVRSLGEIKAELSGEEKGRQIYKVADGDTPLRIAAKNGISFEELMLLNPGVENNLYPGDELLISQSVPKMGVKVTTTVKEEERAEFQIQQETVPSMDIGWTNLKQQGEEGITEVTYEVELIDGVVTKRTQVNEVELKAPVPQILQVGGNRPVTVLPKTSSGAVPSGTFAWPTVAGAINCGFLGYQGHTGSDISWTGCYGYPILASADGVVVVSKNMGGGYGNYIIIEHGGGVQTLYGHASKLLAQVGDVVNQGDKIAEIGSTGRSSGPHVHFEVRLNGTPVNAAPYLYGN